MKTNKNTKPSSINNRTKFRNTCGIKDSRVLRIFKVVMWSAKTYRPHYAKKDFLDWIAPYFQKLDRLILTRGLKEAVRYSKESRIYFLDLLSRDPDAVVKDKFLISRYGKKMLNLVSVDNPQIMSIVMTVLYSTRSLTAKPIVDLGSVVNPLGGTFKTPEHQTIKKFWKLLKTSDRQIRMKLIPNSVRWRNYHFTTKSGPAGHAMKYSTRDLFALPDTLVASIGIVGGKRLKENMNLLLNTQPAEFLKEYDNKPFRRIVAIPDKELKSRNIAILDYFSQTCLKPLHEFLFKILRRIPQDCTFDHGQAFTKSTGWSIYYSIDLTSATDRFPRAYTEEILRVRFGDQYVEAWTDIMVGYPFTTPDKGEVKYSVGQGMGAYSSWATFALSHHYVLFEQCEKLGIPWSSAPYCLVGDDLIIGHDLLAQNYMERMRSMGVELSPQKTHISPIMFEFAKRWWCKGQEITGFPIDSVLENLNKYTLLVGNLLNERKKGYKVDNGLTEAIDTLYSHFEMPSRFRKGIRSKVGLVEHSILMLRGEIPFSQGLTTILRKDLDIPPGKQIKETVAKAIVSEVCSRLFSESMDPDGEGVLGQVAVNLVIILTSVAPSEEVTKYVRAIPILGVYSQIEEMYLRITREALDIDQLRGGDWPTFLRILTIPKSDKIFSDRNQELISVASATVVYKVLNTLEELRYLLGPGDLEDVSENP